MTKLIIIVTTLIALSAPAVAHPGPHHCHEAANGTVYCH